MKELILIIIAYLLGSIPTALIISKKYFGIDIRDYGSGNMGATNTFRVLGSKYGTLVMVFDILKGMAAVALYNFLPHYLNNELDRTNFMIGLGLAAVLGHIFPVFANFKGGKGVATLFGMNGVRKSSFKWGFSIQITRHITFVLKVNRHTSVLTVVFSAIGCPAFNFPICDRRQQQQQAPAIPKLPLSGAHA